MKPLPFPRTYKRDPENDREVLDQVKALCHRFCGQDCIYQKRIGAHIAILQKRPHWSVLKREEQFRKIDQGENVPFDLALPLPARDPGFAETNVGVELFWETFRCLKCGRCCFTPGAGLVLEEGDFQRIAKFIGSRKRLRSLCRQDKERKIWILKQPCPFYDRDWGCTIYPVRPLTCRHYPLHPPLKEMPHHLAVDAFCPGARELAKRTLGWWVICENKWVEILSKKS